MQPGLRSGLKPIDVRRKKKKQSDEEKTVTADQLFRWFSKAGNIDKPDLGIPLVSIDKVMSLKKFVEEEKQKKANNSTQSFFHMLRAKEEILKTDMVFQRKLRRETLAFRQRKLKDKEEEDGGDQESDPDFIDESDEDENGKEKETNENGQEAEPGQQKLKPIKNLKPGVARLRAFRQGKYGAEKQSVFKDDRSEDMLNSESKDSAGGFFMT